MKKRVTIYIEEMVWNEVQRMAYQESAENRSNGREGISASLFVETALKDKLRAPDYKGKCDYCGEIHDLRVICPERRKMELQRRGIVEPAKTANEMIEQQDIEAANKRLMKKREQAAKEKPKKLIKAASDVPQFVGGYSKDKQLGKKEKRGS